MTAAHILILLALQPQAQTSGETIRLQASAPTLQKGSTAEDKKGASRYGKVLGSEWGGDAGDFAEYSFTTMKALSPARLSLRYARQLAGSAQIQVSLDGKQINKLELPSTGGWGDRESEFAQVALSLHVIKPGKHRLRLTIPMFTPPVPIKKLSPVKVLDLVGGRADKNTVGHGKNVALYAGLPSKFFYATQDLTNIFSAVDGQPLDWYPDHVVVTPQGIPPSNANLDEITIEEGTANSGKPTNSNIFEQRQVCVTKDDVVVSKIFITNLGKEAITHEIEVTGDCRQSRDYRGRPGGEKTTREEGNAVILGDKNVFPSVLANGLTMAIGGSAHPTKTDTSTPGAYKLTYQIEAPAGKTVNLTLACAIDPNEETAKANLAKTLADIDPLTQNREVWKDFYANDVPSFTSSDKQLDELYAFRWFLLQFSRAGGDLGYLKYPVVLEGRQAFQTYCCYSAPFMAFDLNWAVNPDYGYGQLANMPHAAYEDGRFPWYATPETNRVPLDHASATGQSLLPWTTWRYYEVHRRKDLIAPLYDGMKKNVDWWIQDRDPDGNGLFSIDHQLETGMDDLHRRWTGPTPKRYEAIDATAYTILNLRAVANMARVLGKEDDAKKYGEYADRAAHSLETTMWDAKLGRYRDRSPDTGELSDYNSLTIFYPMFAGVAEKDHLDVVRRYLLNPKEYWTAHPVPAISQADPEFDTEHRYWAGPTWPATNSHVVEGFAETAKRLDRSLLPDAAELFRRVVALHMRPRPDFYEHYNSLTGAPMSDFRDYMHSWWVDIIIRHVAGLNPEDDGSLTIDPLPMGLKTYALRGAPFAGHKVDVLFNDKAKGLVVRIDGKVIRHEEAFIPGGDPIKISASEIPDK